MIKNLWNVVKIVCGNHGKDTPDMKIEQLSPKNIQYVCSCCNAITVDDYDKVIKKISDEIENAEANGVDVNLKYMKWKQRNIDYKILCFKENKIIVSAVNRKIVPVKR